MDDRGRCRGCGEERPADAPGGLCPACLIRAGLDDGPDLTVTLGPVDPGSLASLAGSLGGIPHVLLRDTDPGTGPDPLIQPASAEMPQAADRPARLQLLGEIARGGMGAILKGRDPGLGRDLAVKVLLEAHRDDPGLVRRFIEEAQIGGQLQHPGIVPVYELGAFADRRPYFAMKLVKGRTLAGLLADRAGPDRDLPRFLSIFESICQTMAYAHARGVIHRDLKPSNVMVGSFGEVQVMDWGLAKVLPRGGAADDAPPGKADAHETVIATAGPDADSERSRAGSVLGTPAYMAPEQARGEVALVDERCDVFALGSILCEILTGRPAFDGRSSGEIQRKAARGDLSDAFARLDSSGSDADLVSLAKSCLAPEPDDRPSHAGDVAARVSTYLADVQVRLRDSELERARAEARATEERKRRQLTVALSASVLAFVTLGGGATAWQIQQRQSRLAGVSSTVARIQALRDQALADGGAARRLREVSAAADQAVESIGVLAASEPGRRLSALRAEIAAERHQSELDRRLLDDLTAVRTFVPIVSYDDDLSQLDSRFGNAFRRYGLDLETTPADKAIVRLESRPRDFLSEVAGNIDYWLTIRRATEDGPAKVRKLNEIAKRIDADPDRGRIRSFLEDAELKPHAEELRAYARRPESVAYSPATVMLLARSLDEVAMKADALALLRAAVLRYPHDASINFELASLLHHATPPQEGEAIRYYTAARALMPGTGRDLAELLQRQGRLDESEALLRDVVRRYPGEVELLFDLFRQLRDNGRADEARIVGDRLTAPFRERLRRGPQSVEVYQKIAALLFAVGDRSGVVKALGDASRLDPNDAILSQRYAFSLYKLGDTPGAIAAYRAAIRANPLDETNRYLLASLLGRSGDRQAKIAELREIIRLRSSKKDTSQHPAVVSLSVGNSTGDGRTGATVGEGLDSESASKPDELMRKLNSCSLSGWIQGFLSASLRISPLRTDVESEQGYLALGIALIESANFHDATLAFTESIKLGETSKLGKAGPQFYLGNALGLEGDLPGAIAAFRESIRLGMELGETTAAQYALAMTLAESGDDRGAIAELRAAIGQDDRSKRSPFHLIRAVLMTRQQGESIAALRRIRGQGGGTKEISEAIDRTIAQYDRIATFAGQIPKIVCLSNQGENLPDLCYEHRFFNASAALWSAEFNSGIPTMENGGKRSRYDAACSAALAGCGKGYDAPPAESARIVLRHLALDWLKPDLASYEKEYRADPSKAKPLVSERLHHWQRDSDLVGVRDPDALARLPEVERAAWRALWADVEALLKLARDAPP